MHYLRATIYFLIKKEKTMHKNTDEKMAEEVENDDD